MMMFGDTSRTERPFAKDPSVIRFRGDYLLYYSLRGSQTQGWAIGIARSRDLLHWEKAGEMLPIPGTADSPGIAAPGAVVIDGKVHLFYQSYGNGPRDALCHAMSEDGLSFRRNPGNPVFRPRGAWSSGRAIDAEAHVFGGRLYLYYATRDPAMKVQMLGVASASVGSDFAGPTWTDHSLEGPILRPELPWERQCIEAPTVCQHGGKLFMFYAGAYNNEPQQIGVAQSEDALHWRRLSDEPLLPNGSAGEWNSSESGHPGVFVDEDGQAYLFYQGNNDGGQSWYISYRRLGWTDDRPVLLGV